MPHLTALPAFNVRLRFLRTTVSSILMPTTCKENTITHTRMCTRTQTLAAFLTPISIGCRSLRIPRCFTVAYTSNCPLQPRASHMHSDNDAFLSLRCSLRSVRAMPFCLRHCLVCDVILPATQIKQPTAEASHNTRSTSEPFAICSHQHP